MESTLPFTSISNLANVKLSTTEDVSVTKIALTLRKLVKKFAIQSQLRKTLAISRSLLALAEETFGVGTSTSKRDDANHSFIAGVRKTRTISRVKPTA